MKDTYEPTFLYSLGLSELRYASFKNYGSISFTSAARDAEISGIAPGNINLAQNAVIENAGSFLVRSEDGDAKGISGLYIPHFINTGTFVVEAKGMAFGTWGVVPPITNGGEIRVTGGLEARALDVRGGPISNTGIIHAIAKGSGLAIAIDFGYFTTDASVNNSGLIIAEDSTSSSDNSVGISIYGFGRTDVYIVNSGTISGDFSIKESGAYDPYEYSAVQNVDNSGILRGKVDLGKGNDIITNSGTIYGAISLGDQNDLYDGRDGRTEGLISGGSGDDTLLGGAAFDYLQGNTGNDSESGGDGDDWIVGGQDQDVLSGDAGADVMNGNLGNDTLSGGSGADWLRGGQGDDSIVGGSGDDWISGDKGADTLAGGAGADMFNVFGGSGTDRVLDFAASEGDRVRIEGGASYEVKQAGGDTVIDLGGGDQLVLVGVQITASSDWIVEA